MYQGATNQNGQNAYNGQHNADFTVGLGESSFPAEQISKYAFVTNPGVGYGYTDILIYHTQQSQWISLCTGSTNTDSVPTVIGQSTLVIDVAVEGQLIALRPTSLFSG